MVERGVAAAPGAAEGVVVSVKRLTGNAPLNGDIYHGQLLFRLTIPRVIHVAVHGEVFVEAPTR